MSDQSGTPEQRALAKRLDDVVSDARDGGMPWSDIRDVLSPLANIVHGAAARFDLNQTEGSA